MSNTPVESISPRQRATSISTPPSSARGLSSARGRAPLASARGKKEPVHVMVRVRPLPPPPSSISSSRGGNNNTDATITQNDSAVVRFYVERSAAAAAGSATPRATPRPMGTAGGSSSQQNLSAVDSAHSLNNNNNNSVTLTVTGPIEPTATSSSSINPSTAGAGGSVTNNNSSSTGSSSMGGGAAAASGGGMEEHRTYEFAEVFDANTTDETVVQTVVPQVLEQLRGGYNAVVMCYGQTGSGKTHSLQVITQNLIEQLFVPTNGVIDFNADFVEMSYIQIYGAHCYNLLAARTAASTYGELLPRPKGVMVSEPYAAVATIGEVQQKLQDAQKRRVVAPHALNPCSSRSHTLLSFRITKCVEGTPVATCKVTLADLAGSERVKKSGVAGEGLDEAIAINKSLSVLHAVIKASTNDSEATVIPFRESILTLYLSPVFSTSYVVLLATVSSEASNYFETKSTLDFATTAKKCVVSRVRGKAVADRFSRSATIEAQLQLEIDTLRHRVEMLRQQVDLDRERSRILTDNVSTSSSGGGGGVNGGGSGDAVGVVIAGNSNNNRAVNQGTVERIREQIGSLELQCVSLQTILRDRENEKIALITRRLQVDDYRNELEQRNAELDEARATLTALSTTTATTTTTGLDSSMLAALDNVREAFLWIEEQYYNAQETSHLLERALETLRAEHRQTSETLMESRRALLYQEEQLLAAATATEELATQNVQLQKKFEALEIQFFREKHERCNREDTVALYNAAVVRSTEMDRLKRSFDEQRNLIDVLQSRLTTAERDLDSSETSRMHLAEEVRTKEESFRHAWRLLTAQQKARFMSSDVSTSAQASYTMQGFDAIGLRAALRSTEKQLQDKCLELETKGYQLEDLQSENKSLTIALKNLQDDYETLVRLESQHNEFHGHLESQISDLFSYIDAHQARQQTLEARLRESQSEVEKLEEEHKQAQRVINDLTARLDKAHEDLKSHEQNKEVLTARLKEAEAEKSNIARMRLEDNAKIADLEKQLRQQLSHSMDVSRRLNQASNRHNNLVAEVNHHNSKGEVLQKKLCRANPEEAARLMKQVRSIDAGRIKPTGMAMGAAALADSVARQTHTRSLRFEVSQLQRNHQLQRQVDYESISVNGDAAGGGGGTTVVYPYHPPSSSLSQLPPPHSPPQGGGVGPSPTAQATAQRLLQLHGKSAVGTSTSGGGGGGGVVRRGSAPLQKGGMRLFDVPSSLSSIKGLGPAAGALPISSSSTSAAAAAAVDGGSGGGSAAAGGSSGNHLIGGGGMGGNSPSAASSNGGTRERPVVPRLSFQSGARTKPIARN